MPLVAACGPLRLYCSSQLQLLLVEQHKAKKGKTFIRNVTSKWLLLFKGVPVSTESTLWKSF